jgi:hypothetical protein
MELVGDARQTQVLRGASRPSNDRHGDVQHVRLCGEIEKQLVGAEAELAGEAHLHPFQ